MSIFICLVHSLDALVSRVRKVRLYVWSLPLIAVWGCGDTPKDAGHEFDMGKNQAGNETAWNLGLGKGGNVNVANVGAPPIRCIWQMVPNAKVGLYEAPYTWESTLRLRSAIELWRVEYISSTKTTEDLQGAYTSNQLLGFCCPAMTELLEPVFNDYVTSMKDDVSAFQDAAKAGSTPGGFTPATRKWQTDCNFATAVGPIPITAVPPDELALTEEPKVAFLHSTTVIPAPATIEMCQETFHAN